MNPLEKRIIELSYRHKLTHISSCLNAVNVLDSIYKNREPNDPVVLANSHSALALYVVLEKYLLCDAEAMIEKHGTHAGRDMPNGIWVSGGSLGQGETIATGLAVADRTRNVWLVTSDGSCAEGCVWEAFHLSAKLLLFNLKIHVIGNGYGGYGGINIHVLYRQLSEALDPLPFVMHDFTLPSRLPSCLQGLAGHYVTINSEQYAEMMQ